MDIGSAMKDFREKYGFSRAQMAKLLGIKPQSVWKIETGHSIPKPTTVDKFCQVVCIPLAYLISKSLTVEDFIWPRPKADGQTQIVDKK